jgi:tetratricopeptide (TPR) repeat protein
MKKLLLTLALAGTMMAAYAQKPDADMQKAVDKALAATQDAKKSLKPASWMNLGKAYMAAYNNPTANFAQGIDRTTFSMMFKEQPSATATVTIDGQQFTRMSFSHVDAYFNASDILVMWDVTKPSVPGNILMNAAQAYHKAFELGAKDKDVAPKMKEIADYFYNDAFTAYSLGDMAKASDLFKGAADVSVLTPSAERNDDAIYNTAFTALATKNYARAEEYYNKCIANGHFMDGNVYASLSEIALAQADTLKAKNLLATGLTAFPDNAPILTNLINLYLSTKEDPAKIVELLDEAKKAMPDNASLYYVEGNIYTGIKDYEKADAAYNKALEIQPGYDMAYYGLATTLLKRGEDLVDAMNALDVREWKKYDEMKVQLDNIYKSALVPFENCYNSSSIPEVKAAAADFLKRLNFQLRSEGAEYQAAYEKWSSVVATPAE